MYASAAGCESQVGGAWRVEDRGLPGIWQLSLHEELLDTLRRVEVALPGHPLHLLQLLSPGSRLNVPEAIAIS